MKGGDKTCSVSTFRRMQMSSSSRFCRGAFQGMAAGKSTSWCLAGKASCDGFHREWDAEEPLVGSSKGAPKPPDPLITTVACEHGWGGLIPPLHHHRALGCKFLPAGKSRNTLIKAWLSPQLGMMDFPEVTRCAQLPSPPQWEHMEYIVV